MEKANVKEKLKVILGVAIAVLVFSFMFYHSITGIFSEEVLLKVSKRAPRYMVFSGHPKYLLCFSGLGITAPILYMFIKAAYVKLFNPSSIGKKDFFINKLLLPIVAFSFVGLVIAYIWQSLLLPAYR